MLAERRRVRRLFVLCPPTTQIHGRHPCRPNARSARTKLVPDPSRPALCFERSLKVGILADLGRPPCRPLLLRQQRAKKIAPVVFGPLLAKRNQKPMTQTTFFNFKANLGESEHFLF
jgi:hypothetical protein